MNKVILGCCIIITHCLNIVAMEQNLVSWTADEYATGNVLSNWTEIVQERQRQASDINENSTVSEGSASIAIPTELAIDISTEDYLKFRQANPQLRGMVSMFGGLVPPQAAQQAQGSMEANTAYSEDHNMAFDVGFGNFRPEPLPRVGSLSGVQLSQDSRRALNVLHARQIILLFWLEEARNQR